MSLIPKLIRELLASPVGKIWLNNWEDTMRFVTYVKKNKSRIGLVLNSDQLVDLAEINNRYLKVVHPRYVADMQSFIESGSKALGVTRKAARYVEKQNDKGLKRLRQVGILQSLNQVRLLSPIPWPRKNIILLGINYQEHIAEGARARSVELKIPEAPVYFTKPATSVIGHQGKVIHHEATKRLDFEVELAVVMGKKGRNISVEKVNEYIFGYTVLLDMTARDLQRRHGQWFKGKSLDTFCPMGPWILHKNALLNPHELQLVCRVNGEIMQNGNTRDMIFNIPTTIAELSKGMTLEPGDIISTGTPSGVGYARVPPLFLKPGDRVEAEVEGVGTLEVVVVLPK